VRVRAVITMLAFGFGLALSALGVACTKEDEDTAPNGAATTEPTAVVQTEPPATEPPAPAPTTVVTQQPAPTQPPAPAYDYACEAGASCNCSDFPTHAEAQRIYELHGGNNWAGLDRDKDGIACESLP